MFAFAFTAKAQDALRDYEVKDEPPRGVTVTDRRRPELDPRGIRTAGFLFYPKFAVTEKYDDNIFSTETGEEDDFITIVSPSFWLRSNWRNHALNFFGTADIGFKPRMMTRITRTTPSGPTVASTSCGAAS